MAGGERRYPPTPQHTRRMREQGVLPRSTDVMAFAVLLAAVLALRAVADGLVHGSATAVSGAIRQLPRAGEVLRSPDELIALVVAPLVLPLAVLLGAGAVAAIVVGVLHIGPNFAPTVLMPQMQRLNRLSQIFSSQSLVELLRSLAKITFALAVLASVIWGRREQFEALAHMHPLEASALLADMVMELTMKMLVLFAVIAALDLLYRRRQHDQRMLMTREDHVRDLKELEQGLEIAKGEVMQRMRARLRRFTGEAHVPSATTVITNPTHVAVAVRYDPAVAPAPFVVAKGTGAAAARIRTIARAAGVPVVEDPPLARELYRRCEEGDIVPAVGDLWMALSAILREIYRAYPERRPRLLDEL